jgi:hypothetical protein
MRQGCVLQVFAMGAVTQLLQPLREWTAVRSEEVGLRIVGLKSHC